MKKLKLLRWSLLIIMGLWLLGLAGKFIFMIFYGGLVNYEIFRFGSYTFAISTFLSMVLFFAFYYAFQGITKIINTGYYNDLSIKKFKASGVLIICTQLISTFFQIMNSSPRTLESTISFWIMDALLLLIGIGLLSISDLLNEGKILKDENDLMI